MSNTNVNCDLVTFKQFGFDLQNWTVKVKQRSTLCLPFHFDRGSCVHSTLFDIFATRTLLQTLGWYANIHMITPVELHIPKFLRWGVLYTHLSRMQVANNVPFNNLGGTIPCINCKAWGDQHINWEPGGNPGINWGAPEHHTTNSTAQQIPFINSKSPRGSNYQLRCSKNPYINWKGSGSRNTNWEAMWNQNMNWKKHKQSNPEQKNTFGKCMNQLRNSSKSRHHLRSPRQSKYEAKRPGQSKYWLRGQRKSKYQPKVSRNFRYQLEGLDK